MWDNYYDKVMYKEKQEKLDSFGNIVYKEARQIDVREVSGGIDFEATNSSIKTKYSKEYHIPFEVKEGDKIDDRLIVYVDNNKDVFGNFHFCIAGVE